MITRIVFLVTALLVAVLLLRLLRSSKLREKYAALWILIGAAIVFLAVWPGALNYLSEVIGIALPVNLLFFLSILLLLGVGLHLSTEATRLEDEVRTLNEEVAMLWQELREMSARLDGPGSQDPQGQALAPDTLDPDSTDAGR